MSSSTIYKHRYSNPYDTEEYEVVAFYANGDSNVTDPSNEVEWVGEGNTPEKISGNRFITIVEGVVTVDPDMEDILAAEAAAQAVIDAAHAEKLAMIEDIKAAYTTIMDDFQDIIDANAILQARTESDFDTPAEIMGTFKAVGNNIEKVVINLRKVVKYLYNEFMNGD